MFPYPWWSPPHFAAMILKTKPSEWKGAKSDGCAAADILKGITCMSGPVCCLFHRRNDEIFPSFQGCLPCKVVSICSSDTLLELQTTIGIRWTRQIALVLDEFSTHARELRAHLSWQTCFQVSPGTWEHWCHDCGLRKQRSRKASWTMSRSCFGTAESRPSLVLCLLILLLRMPCKLFFLDLCCGCHPYKLGKQNKQVLSTTLF
jgi:hypothetical protein